MYIVTKASHFNLIRKPHMQGTPVLYFAFANDPDEHLALLKKESQQIHDHLMTLDQKEMIKVVREESAEISDLFKVLSTYKDQLVVFHFGGHADGTRLALEKQVGHAGGLAKMLAELPNLQFVVLNGCSTQEQVETLFAAGIKAVIATSVSVADTQACDFGAALYESLARRMTIRQAFNMAAGLVKTKYKTQAEIISWRGFKPETSSAFPWALYVNDDEALEYHLPFSRSISLPEEITNHITQSFTSNRFIMLVLNEMCKYNDSIYQQMVEHRGDQSYKRDSKDYPEIIIKNFPWPIGAQILQLHHQDTPNRERLKTLISTYVITGQVLYYILLSDLWDQHHDGKLTLAIDQSSSKGRETFEQFDFLAALCQIFQQVAPQQPALYVPEIAQFCTKLQDASEYLHKAHQFLENVRKQLTPTGHIPDIEKLCLTVEQAVATVLTQASFLARFRMMTVRTVLVDKPRFAPLAYDLSMGPLNAITQETLGLYKDEQSRRKDSYTDSRSVVLVADENRMEDALNLSPFIMDKNTFVQVKKSQTTGPDKADVAHIFLMGWEENDRLTYLAVNHSIYTALANANGGDQVHTAQTQADFTEGRNMGEDTFAFDMNMDFGFGQVEQKVSSSPKVFELLWEQYVLFMGECCP